MILKNLIVKTPILKIVGNIDINVSKLCIDSREVSKDTLFFAIEGTSADGHSYIEKAINSGANAIVCTKLPQYIYEDVTYILVKDSSSTLGKIASTFYDNPSTKLKLIGITGTNGKTTTTTLLHLLLARFGKKSALISTINIQIGDSVIQSTHTTPNVIRINEILSQAVKEGCQYAIMEVSSHGISQKRIEGLHFAIAGFTNITRDHLDYHLTFKNYLNTKKLFFDNLSSHAIAISNLDDKNGELMLQNSVANKKFYALKSMADYKGKIIENRLDATLIQVNGIEFWIQLTGEFNVYNTLLVYGIAESLGYSTNQIINSISELKSVSGRFDTSFTQTGQCIIVDYAHTPDALENVIKTILTIKQKDQKLYTIVGCGGNRDKGKRPIMAKIATSQSNYTILTSDNPRFEEPNDILRDMKKGAIGSEDIDYSIIADRQSAIKTALNRANKNDIILIAGKGHETYQEIKGKRTEFDDKKIALMLSKQTLN